ncbi:efflux RND transporter periplasmic adaptor subunit [Novispirillum itersonii]|uniref:Membrane fusion protein (Multidrug efflux system) n=1 Tax=Novispirillum itersonii TaxID=189 RepID=A0A7W9ZDA1_NOVIT|nr:efflux RND transporter periplasmic adaptor subunit [Novispirillum itersonii]MBB6209393.1 membrane fusion protein (multidrug efflux system) [Novispirillum itersonii]
MHAKRPLFPVAIPLALASALILAACDEAPKQQAAAPGGGMPPVEVAVITATPSNVPVTTDLPGRTTAFRVAEVRPQVSGIVLKRLFEEGSDVQAGQQLYQIDPAPYQAVVQSAQADLVKARASLKSVEAKAARYAELVKINAVSRQDYDDVIASLDQAKAQIQVAQAAIDTARINLDYTKVYAPIAGRIGKSAVTEGALVTANQTTSMALITQLDPIYVDLNQSSADLMRMKQAAAAGSVQRKDAAPVTLLLDGVSKPYAHTGELKFSDVTVDESTGSVQVRAVFPNPDRDLFPGLFVRARIEQGVRDNVFLIPQQAVVRTPAGATQVWVVNADNTVAPRPVETTQAAGDSWIVTGGLTAGDKVVTAGIQKIKPGATVRVAAPAQQQ